MSPIISRINSLVSKRQSVSNPHLVADFLQIVENPGQEEFPLEFYLDCLAKYGINPIPQSNHNPAATIHVIENTVDKLVENGFRRKLLVSKLFSSNSSSWLPVTMLQSIPFAWKLSTKSVLLEVKAIGDENCLKLSNNL